MAHTPHELHEEFPAKAETIRQLKTGNAHFARLADEYHDLNRQVHRAETRVDLMSEEDEEHLRKRRAQLKDQISRMLAQA